MTFEQIINDLQRKSYFPIYLLMGEEPYYIDEIANYIEDNILDETEKEFNQTVIYGKDINIPTLISYAKRYPMMAEHQVIIVREAQDIKDIEELASYADHPVASTILVICYKYKKIDKRRSLAKALSRNGILFESPKLYDNKVPQWISSFIEKRGFKINPNALMLVAEHLGNDLGTIVNELQKLIINLQPGEVITPETVEQNIGISKEYNVFELQKAMGQRDSFRTFKIIKYLGSSGKEVSVVGVTATLYSYFNKLLIYHSIKDKSKNNVASILGVNPYFVDEYATAASRYNPKRLEKVMHLLREYDMKAKGVDNLNTESSMLLTELAYHILN